MSELNEDAVEIATHLREFETQSTWSIMKRAEALMGKGAASREETLKQLGHRDWGA